MKRAAKDVLVITNINPSGIIPNGFIIVESNFIRYDDVYLAMLPSKTK